MAGNNSIQFLRGSNHNSTAQLLPGQPYYDYTNNELFIGGSNGTTINKAEAIGRGYITYFGLYNATFSSNHIEKVNCVFSIPSVIPPTQISEDIAGFLQNFFDGIEGVYPCSGMGINDRDGTAVICYVNINTTSTGLTFTGTVENTQFKEDVDFSEIQQFQSIEV